LWKWPAITRPPNIISSHFRPTNGFRRLELVDRPGRGEDGKQTGGPKLIFLSPPPQGCGAAGGDVLG